MSAANVRRLRENLDPRERLVVVAQASDRRLRLGLLAATTARLLFVRERFGREPVVLSLPFADIREVRIEHQPLTGVLIVELENRSIRFGLVQPKERTWPLWWTVHSRLRVSW